MPEVGNWPIALVTAALWALLLSGCGGSDDPRSASGLVTSTATPTTTTPAQRNTQGSEGSLRSSPPEIPVPTGLPPKKLVVKDLTEGTGAEAKKGDEVQIQYYGVQWSDGAEQANSWHYEHIPVFTLGNHRLLRGLNMAIPGMKEGGSREVIIPYNLVYYPGDTHSRLSPLDALIYKVYLVKVLG